jgi:NADPH:quinone reductase-like Zn-dependent oxidoreductase
MLAAPINPADLNILEGKYGELPTLPCIPGSEGAGRVLSVGTGVSDFKPGDLVAVVRRGTWAKHLTVSAKEIFPLPSSTDPLQASMLGVNPPTAFLMLKTLSNLQPGEWILQNAANSGVGRSVIQIARALGLRTLNIVRRPELVAELTALGADCVLTEDDDLREMAGQIFGGQPPRLALNAVGGASALNLANALARDGHLVTYGAMGRQPLKIPNGLLIFKNLTFSGFWLTRWKMTTTPDEQKAVFHKLASMLAGGGLRLAVHATHPMDAIESAIADAASEKRTGKVLLDLAA